MGVVTRKKRKKNHRPFFGRRLIGAFIVMCILSAFVPSGLLIKTAEAATTITPTTGGRYTITTSGEYNLTNASVTNYEIVVNTGVTAALNVTGAVTINNSGGVWSKSGIRLVGTAKLTINLANSSAKLDVYGSPGKAGDLSTTTNPGAYAGINVPSTAGLIIQGNGYLYAHGGDAGDVNDYNSTGGEISAQGGGGGGAGIGGNGGYGAKTGQRASIGNQGGEGGAAGTIQILQTVKVYAYGGGGGKGGYANSYGASSGGGYPGAGVGGGGAGGGSGGTQSAGDGGGGGGGFSGGSAEGVYGRGTCQAGTNGLGAPYSNNMKLAGGGGYFSYGSRGTLNTSNYGAIGGGGGGTNTYRGGNGGKGGNGGTVVKAQTSTLNAYNGNYITTSTSAAQGWGKNPTPIYGQLGFNPATMRGVLVGAASVTGRTDAAVLTELTNKRIAANVARTYYTGVGTGAGYTETSNGTFYETPNAPTNVNAEYVKADETNKITVNVTWKKPEITTTRPVYGYKIYVDGVLKGEVQGADTLTATVSGAGWVNISKIEVKSYYYLRTNGMSWESTSSGLYNFIYEAPPIITGTRTSNTSFNVHWSGTNNISRKAVSGYTIYYKVGDYDGEEMVPTESDYDVREIIASKELSGDFEFTDVTTEKLYYIRMVTHFKDGTKSAISAKIEVTDVYIAPLAPNFKLTWIDNHTVDIDWLGAEGTGLTDYVIYYQVDKEPDTKNPNGGYTGAIVVPGTENYYRLENVAEERTYYFVIETRTAKYGTDVSAPKSIFVYVMPEEIQNYTVTRVDDTRAEIEWSGARGSGIESYTVFYSDDENDLEKYTYTYEYDQKSGSFQIENLNTDSFWYFRIQSNTAELGSSPISEVKRIYSFNSPKAPAVVTGKWVSTTSAQISWSAASGTDIIGYRVYYDYGGPDFTKENDSYIFPVDTTGQPRDDDDEEEEEEALPEIITVPDGQTYGTVLIENLPNKTSSPRRRYYFRIETVTNPYIVDKEDEAIRTRQYGELSEKYADVLLYDNPSQPVLGTIYAGNGFGRISTLKVEDDGDDPIITYHIYAVSDSDNSVTETVWDVDGDTELTDLHAEELTNGEGYTITVTAENAAGESVPSEEQWIRAGVPTTPENFKIETGELRAIHAEYDEADGNGFPVLGYHIFLNGNQRIDTPDDTTTETRYTTYGKYSGDQVKVQVTAFNQWGDSPMTAAYTRIAGAPTTTYIDKVTYYGGDESKSLYDGKTGVDLHWPKSFDNGYRVRYYTVYLTDTETGEVKEYTAKELDEEEVVIGEVNIPATDLVRGRRYSASVEPVNLAGLGERSVEREFVYGVPQPPVITRLDVNTEELTVYYTKPNDNGKPITEYHIYLNGVLRYTLPSYTSPYLMDLLINGREYSVQVSAVNADGESELSEPWVGTPGDRPLAPRNLKANALTDTEIQLNWSNPSYTGGLDLTNYYILAYHLVKDGETVTEVPIKLSDVEEGDVSSVGEEEEYTVNPYIKAVDGETREALIDGLEKGESYKFEVAAVNRAGRSAYVEISNIATLIEPDTPVITSVVSDAGSSQILPINMTWKESNIGDGEEDGYTVYLINESAENEEDRYVKINREYLTGSSARFTSSQLLRGNTYKLTMRAHNAVGYSDYAEPVVLNMGIPPAPINLQVSASQSELSISWEMEDLENIIVTGYRVYLNNTSTAAKIVSGSTNMSTVISDLEPKKTYTVYVRAINNIGSGALSEPVTVTLGTPTKPLDIVAAAGHEKIDVSWSEPAVTNGYPITSYHVYVNNEYDSTIANRTIDVVEGETPTLSTTIDNLIGGQEYTISVTAINDAGESVHSDVRKATPWTVPPAPEVKGDTISAADTSFEFVFVPSTTNLKVERYDVYLDDVALDTKVSTVNPYVSLKQNSDGNYVATVYNVPTGKAAGKDYGHTFYVKTVTENPYDPDNNLESFTPAEEDKYTVTTGIPMAPVITLVEPGNGTVRLKYEIPNAESVGISYYEVVYDATTHKYNSNDITITGLTNQRRYSFVVRGVNSAGVGPYSYTVNAIPGTVPAPVLTANPGDKSAILSWAVDVPANIPLPNKYNIYQDGEFIMESDTVNVTVPNLTNGQEYTFQVSAINRNGEGQLSNSAATTPRNGAGQVTNFRSKALSATELELTWDDPLYDGGSPITAFRVSGKGTISTGTVDEKKSVVSGLEQGKLYKFTIYARTAFGLGEPFITDYIRTMTYPGAPVINKISSADTTISVKWDAPEDTGEDIILGYNVYLNGSETPVNDTLITDRSFVIPKEAGLEEGLEYGVSIAAVNSIGEGTKSTVVYTDVVGKVERTAPYAPQNVKVVPKNTAAEVSWTKPKSDGNSDIIRYLIYAGRTEDTMSIRETVDGDVYVTTLTGLLNNVTYYFSVVAVNEVTEDNGGQGPMSDIVTAIPYKFAIPSVPSNLKYEINATGDEMTVDWDASTGEGSIYYKVYVNGQLYKKIEDGSTQIKVPVIDGVKYSVQIITGNESGEAASQYIYAYNNLNIRDAEGVLNLTDANYDGVMDEIPVYYKPDAVDEFTKTRDGKELTLRWKKVTSNKYTVNKYNLYVSTSDETKLSFAVDPETGEPKSSDLTLDAEGYYETKIDIDYGIIYTMQVSAENEQGESSKSVSLLEYVKINQYPTDLTVEQNNPDDTTKFTISWIAPNEAEPVSYLLYVNESIIPIALSDLTIDHETGKCTLAYDGDVNTEYIFRVSAVYSDGHESTRTAAEYADTYERIPTAPTNLTGTAKELNKGAGTAKIELEWTAPEDCEFTYYNLYVNGELYSEKISKDVTSYEYNAQTQMFYIFRLAAVNGETEGPLSSPAAVDTIIEDDSSIEANAPQEPSNVQVALDEKQTKLTITWEAPDTDNGLYLPAAGYNIYINGEKVNSELVTEDGSGNLIFEYPVEPSTVYSVQIEAVAEKTDGESGETTYVNGKKSSPVIVETDSKELPILDAPLNLDGALDEDTLEITLNWDSVEKATSYNLYVYSSAQQQIIKDITDTTYVYTAARDTDYVFRVTAVYTKDDQSTESNKSNRYAVSTIDEDSIVIPNPAGAPTITKSRSNGTSKVNIYWKAPEEDADGIIGYYVFKDGIYERDSEGNAVIVPVTPVNSEGLYVYTFENVPEGTIMDTKVVAIKKYNNQYILGSDSNIWRIKLELNIVDKWPPGDDDDYSPKDNDGDGEVDEIGSTIKLIGRLNAGSRGEGLITIYDEYDEVVKEQTLETGDFEVFISDITEAKNYKLEFSKKNYASYIITNVPLDHTMDTVNVWDVTPIPGDVTGDGRINIDDLSVLNNNYGKSGTDLAGDITASGRVGLDDLTLLNMHYGEREKKLTWSEHNSSINN